MARKESVQQKLGHIRAPRVKLTYDVEKADGIEQKEIPFVIGVISDLSGDPLEPLPKIRDRQFVAIDSDSFDDVLAGIAPRLRFRVPNRISPAHGEFAVELNFRSIDDFRPEAVVQQVEPLRRLLEMRSRLADLRNKLAGNDRLEDILQETLGEPAALAAIGSETGNED